MSDPVPARRVDEKESTMHIMNIVRKAPKRLYMAVAVAAAVVTVPAALLAWGPDRPTYTTQHPADHVTFNSITNNPVQGDERNFVQVKESTAGNSTYKDSISLAAGKEYTVFMYYHNNAASNLNASGKGIAKGVNAKAEIPAIVPTGSNGTKAVGYINASNATPKSVSDDISFSNKTGGDIALRYVPGSATIHNKGKTNGATLSDSIVTSGAKLGYDSLNGVVPGCNQYAGYITFKVKADQANFTVEKKVRKLGSTAWSKSVNAQPGDKVEYLIGYKNTGTTKQNDVVVKDTLPKGVSYVNGTTMLKNALNPNGKKVSDNVTKDGINISNYTPGSNAYVWFTAQIGSKDELPCGTQKLVNKATVETNNGNKSDTADVIVDNGECAPTPEYRCDALSVDRLSRTSFKFSTAYTVKNADVKGVTYVVRDANGKEVYRGSDATYTQEKAGTYTVQAYVNVEVNGAVKTVSSDDCKKSFKVVPPTDHCPIPGKEKLPADSKDCKEDVIKVCEIKTGRIVTIKESDFSSDYSKDLSDCEKQPELPNELPVTGAADMVAKLSGLVSLTAATAYYLASRRN